MLRIAEAVASLVRTHFPDSPKEAERVEVRRCYDIFEPLEAKTPGRRLVCVSPCESAQERAVVEAHTSRGSWREQLAFRVTFQELLVAETMSQKDLAFVAADRLRNLFRENPLAGIGVRWLKTLTAETHSPAAESQNGVFFASWIVVYERHHVGRPEGKP